MLGVSLVRHGNLLEEFHWNLIVAKSLSQKFSKKIYIENAGGGYSQKVLAQLKPGNLFRFKLSTKNGTEHGPKKCLLYLCLSICNTYFGTDLACIFNTTIINKFSARFDTE